MPESHDANPVEAKKPSSKPSEATGDLSQAVRRAMLEVAELREIQERVTALSERIARLTSPFRLGPE